MHVHLVSGIFVSPRQFREHDLQETMETLLADGLSARGVDVTVSGHALVHGWDADVVHIHHLANSCVRLAVPQKQPIVFTRHATKAVPLHHALVLKQTYRRASAVVALSRTERALLSQVVPTDKLRVIYNGTDQAKFPLVARNRPHLKPWRLLYVGQLIELKRVEIAIRSVAELRARGIWAELDIISHRPTLRPTLEHLAGELGIEDRVRFLPPHSRSELNAALQSAHALLLPSRTEALPTVVTEATFSALPVVAFNVGGIREQVPDSVELPDVEDITSYFRQLHSILENYESVVAAYMLHRDVAAKRFSIARMVEEHIAMYESVSA